jgi:chorismate mutase
MPTLDSKLITDTTQLWSDWVPNSDSLSLTNRLKSGKTLRVIGPCAAQTEEQMLAIAAIVAPKTDALRAPDKKPRTRPVKPDGSPVFHGIGHEKSKPIFETLRHAHPTLVIAAETMTDADVIALTGLIGLAWSGSRTQEQESLQNLGAAARIANLPMMIKNPLTPDPEFYLGMMENWILGAGIALPLIACVRGETPFTPEDKAIWRNRPNLKLVDELRHAFPRLPIIIDPSHMVKSPKTGEEKEERLNTVVDLVRRGIDRGASGFMVEVHHPDHPSLTDPGENVFELMDRLDKYGLL